MVAQIVSAAGAGGDGSWRSAPAARQRARGAMYATRCLAQALVCSCAAGEGGFHTGLSLLWAIAPPRRSLERRAAQGLVPACGRACVCTPRWRHSPAWRLPTRRPRGDRDQRRLVALATTTISACSHNTAAVLRSFPPPPGSRGLRHNRGGAGHVWLFGGAVCRNRFLGKKTQKQRHSQPQK